MLLRRNGSLCQDLASASVSHLQLHFSNFDNSHIFEVYKIRQYIRTQKPCSYSSYPHTTLLHQAFIGRDYVIFARFPQISKRHHCSTLAARCKCFIQRLEAHHSCLCSHCYSFTWSGVHFSHILVAVAPSLSQTCSLEVDT